MTTTDSLTDAIRARHTQRWTLRFTDDAVEEEYVAVIHKRINPIIKVSGILACIIHPIFGLLDYLVSDKYLFLWQVRYIFGMPILLFGLWLVHVNKYHKLHQPYVVVTLSLLSLSIVAMIHVGDAYVASHYYTGLILVILFGALLFYIRFIYMAGVLFLALTSYGFVAIRHQLIDKEDLINSTFFLMSIGTLAVIAAYFIEYALRQYFIKTKMEQALFESESANKAKNDFLAVMNHELRSPLIAIKGFAEVAMHELVGDMAANKETYKDYAKEINTSADHLLHIINDILDYSKVSSGRIVLDKTPFSVATMMEECVRMLHPQAQAKNLSVTIDCPPALTLNADRQLTKQMLINLLSNAIKFTPEGKAITLTAAEKGGDMILTVADEGIGIAPEHQHKVLEPFIQIDDPFSREQASLGTGLGLPFVKKVMGLHGGSLQLESVQKVGTCIRLVFPQG